MLVYDVTNQKSFDNIKSWIKTIEENATSDVERMLIGNKSDMYEIRQIPVERGQKIAKEYDIPYYETSAKLNLNIEEAFYAMARSIKVKYEMKKVIFELVVASRINFLFYC